ncbi:hypothetical protein MPI44_004515 [Klebsiella oxytoca]|nr:hypothetical protein [Klebsiella oxytoca]
MCGCALIEYNNHSAKLRGIVLPHDVELVLFALNKWAIIAFNIRNTDEKFTRIPVEDWIDGIINAVKPSPYRERVIAALTRCRPDIF